MASPSSSTPSPPPPPPLSPMPEPLLLPESKPGSAPKKSPPVPWTHQETLALIQAYQEKWGTHKKFQLLSYQWEEVAITVASLCDLDEPSRTSSQCRHKMEKLRKRYRSELQKPYPKSWQYFELMDQEIRRPMPLNPRPIANSNDVNHSFHSGSVDDYNDNNSRSDGGGSDESDDEWNAGYCVEAAKKNKSKSIINTVRGDGKRGFMDAKRVAMEERGFSGGSSRGERVLRNAMNGKQKLHFDEDDSDDDKDDEDEDGVEEEKMRIVGEGEECGGGRELAAEIRGFAERFMRMENKKIEMMRETEAYWMEMEKKKMGMILEAQRKIIDSIGSAFGARKKAKMARES